jgi:hypothetical protein
MRNLKSYEDWLILEKNRAVEFFTQHPELLKPKFNDIDPHKNGWDPKNSGINIDNQWGASEEMEPYLEKAEQSLLKLNGGNDIKVKGSRDTVDAFSRLTGNYRKEFYGLDDVWEAFKKNNDFAGFLKAIDRIYYSFDYGNKIKDEPELLSFIEKNYREVRSIFVNLQNAIDGLKNRARKAFQNDLKKIGVNEKDLETAMSWVKEWTSMSRKRLPEYVWPILQDISVDSSKLPKYVYRGLFYDGAKIKDQKKFLDKWKLGEAPNASQGKATSWSVDPGTAASFMDNQDFIKDVKNGYYMMLRWEVDPRFVIADLRNLPVDHRFWNQQEIIVSPEAKNYTIYAMISGSEDRDVYRDYVKSLKGSQGGSGQMKKEMMSGFLNHPFDTIDVNTRIEWKRISHMTVAEVADEYGIKINYIPEIQSKIQDCNYALVDLVKSISAYPFKIFPIGSISEDEIEIEVEIELSDLDYGQSPELKEIVKVVKKEIDYNQFVKPTKIYATGSVKIINNGFYNIQIIFDLPKKFEIVKDKEENNIGLAEKSKIALERIFDEFGEKNFVDLLVTTINNKDTTRVSKNIQISTK